MGKDRERIDLLGIVSIGFFLILAGVILAANPGLPSRIYEFFLDFRLQPVYPGVSFYGPASVSGHETVYSAAFQFCLGFAIFQVAILAARFILHEPARRKAGTFSGLFFWFGAAAALWLLVAGSIDWFIFLGWLVVLVGLAITVRCVIAPLLG
jgi:hypothetical protein